MPELPEVETTRRGLTPHLVNETVKDVIIRNGRLRWPVPPELGQYIIGHQVEAITRRGKYLLIKFQQGHLMVHLGMSGSLTMVQSQLPPGSMTTSISSSIRV